MLSIYHLSQTENIHHVTNNKHLEQQKLLYQHANQGKYKLEYFHSATASVFLLQKHPVVYVAIIPCDMGSQGEGIGRLGGK